MSRAGSLLSTEIIAVSVGRAAFDQLQLVWVVEAADLAASAVHSPIGEAGQLLVHALLHAVFFAPTYTLRYASLVSVLAYAQPPPPRLTLH